MGRARGRPAAGEAEDSRRRILDAAAEEFSLAGYRGARIEAIARTAGCNRALVYFYFKSKAGLFEAVLDDLADFRAGQIAAQPATLAEALVYWFQRNMADRRRIRLVMQEALAEADGAPIPARRISYFRRQLEAVKAFQDQGLLRRDLDPRHLLTLILALTSFPASFPRVVAVTLDADEEEAMTKEWSNALAQLAALLAPPPPRKGNTKI
jgi:TetR/AcrR family transcriptional regulator